MLPNPLPASKYLWPMVEKGEVRVCAWMCAHMCVFVWGLAEREKSWVNLEDTKKRQESFRGKGSSWQPSEEHHGNKFFFGALRALSFFGVTRSFVWHKKQSISYDCKKISVFLFSVANHSQAVSQVSLSLLSTIHWQLQELQWLLGDFSIWKDG